MGTPQLSSVLKYLYAAVGVSHLNSGAQYGRRQGSENNTKLPLKQQAEQYGGLERAG